MVAGKSQIEEPHLVKVTMLCHDVVGGMIWGRVFMSVRNGKRKWGQISPFYTQPTPIAMHS